MLTPQLRRVALAHQQGLSPDDICARLGITRHTLKSYRMELYARLDVRSSAELVQELRALADDVVFDLRRHLPVMNTPMSMASS